MKARLLAFAQLLRLPNVFTAFADILMASCAVGSISGRPEAVMRVLLASGYLYLFGMVLNDLCDFREDEKFRSFRPLPSKRVSKRNAWGLALGLLTVGLAIAGSIRRHSRSPVC
jgi:4-hydroxybenzoate polyprenyltransferase